MNVFNKVTLQSLKMNRTRTAVTIIGIMLSAALICAVTTSVSSFYNYILENMIYNNGDWHGSEENAGIETYEKLTSSDEVTELVYAQHLGYAVAEGCTNDYKPYIFVIGVSEGFSEMMPVHITAGRYPASGYELILPEHLLSNGGVQHKIGDILTLGLGERVSDGYTLGQDTPYLNAEDSETAETETLTVKDTRSYEVVGFYERPDFEGYTAPGYTAITVLDGKPSDGFEYSLYFKVKDPDIKAIAAFMDENGLEGDVNQDVLYAMGNYSSDNFYVMLTGLAAVIMALIMFGSVALIYNAFSISISERTKQFGLLSSIGATKKQLRRMVLFEAAAVSAVGIPIGIIVGIGGIGTTLLIIGKNFASLIGAPIPMRVNVSVESIVIAVIVAVVTVLISAWIPSRRATCVTAVEAIRQSADIRVSKRSVRTSGIAGKLFGLPGMLAEKYFKRSRKKYRATILSLFMSIVLFVAASAFTDYLTESVSGQFSTYGYDLVFYGFDRSFENTPKDELLDVMRETEHVTAAAYTKSFNVTLEVKRDDMSARALQNLDLIGLRYTDESSPTLMLDVRLCFVNDAEFVSLLDKYGLDKAEFTDPGAPLAVAVDGISRYDGTEGKRARLELLGSDRCEMTLNSGEIWGGDYSSEDAPEGETVLRSGKTVYEAPYYSSDGDLIRLIYPLSAKEKLLPNVDAVNTFYLTSDDHAASYTALRKTLNENGFSGGDLTDRAEYAERDRNIVTIVRVFAYGFIVLISLIATANVFNTISTNVGLRRREFAMLKSVGMSSSGFNRMMNYECLLYGTRALLYGLPVSAVVTYLIFRVTDLGFDTRFRLPWKAMLIAVLCVFAVVFVTMMYSMSKIKKDNPIDALKNENL